PVLPLKWLAGRRGENSHSGWYEEWGAVRITDDLDRREQEHQQKWPKGHIMQVGRRTTEEAARKWEEEKRYD
ncbi:hypothetical protein JW916_09575, partial [Candidatus Sumerlaeota bacterium]|nr:hypothetical protein [Candidatus Sumerlaeota bacterium]